MAVVTIIIPSFNHADFLQERLNSISSQTFQDWEAIIIDDCSTDESAVILKKFAEENREKIAHFSVNASNSGSGYTSWRKGIELAKTNYIWIAETDDAAEPEFLEKQLELLEKFPDAALVFCNSQYINTEGVSLYTSRKRNLKLQLPNADYSEWKGTVLTEKLPVDTLITNGSSVVFRKPQQQIPSDLFTNKQCSDIFLWTFLVHGKTFVFNSLLLNLFRQHANSTTTLGNEQRLKSIYIEKFKYLDYFSEQQKAKLLLKDYVKNCVIPRRSEWFSNAVFEEIPLLKKLKLFYYTALFNQLLFKLRTQCQISFR